MAERSYEKDIVARLKKLSHRGVMHVVGDARYRDITYSLFALEFARKLKNPWVLFSSGVHGDETASVFSLLNFLERDIQKYAPVFNFLIFPCMNPGGYERNTRENPNGADINRNFLLETEEMEVRLYKGFLERFGRKFLFLLDLHEDPSDVPVPGYDPKEIPRAFYCYEQSFPETKFGPTLINFLEGDGIDIWKGENIYGDKNDGGVIWLDLHEKETARGTFNEYMLKFTDHAFVIETPTCWDWERRLFTHDRAFHHILEEFKKRYA